MPLQPPRQTGRIVAWGVALTAALLIAIALQPPSVAEGEPENLAGEYGFGDQLAGLHRVPGGWVGQTNPTWAGATDSVAALAVCRVLSAQLSPGPRDTITLLRPEGVPLTECGPPLDALEDPS
jgi:hypothetical protein